MLEIRLVCRSRGQEHRPALVAQGRHLLHRSPEVLEEPVKPVNRGVLEHRRQGLSHDDAVLKRVPQARGRIQTVLDDPPRAVGRAGEVDGVRVDEGPLPLSQARAGAQVLGIGGNEGGRKRCLTKEPLRTVEILQKGIVDVGSLPKAGRQLLPIRGAHEEWQGVQGPGLRGGALPRVDVHAHVLLNDGPPASLGSHLHRSRRIGPQQVKECLPMRTNALRTHALVIPVRPERVVGKQGPCLGGGHGASGGNASPGMVETRRGLASRIDRGQGRSSRTGSRRSRVAGNSAVTVRVLEGGCRPGVCP